MTPLTNASQPGAPPGLSDAAINLRHLLLGHVVARAVQAAAELDLANHLKEGGKDCAELATLCGSHAPTLSRLMRMLVSIGVFAESEGRFSNNAMSELLRSDVPQSMRRAFNPRRFVE